MIYKLDEVSKKDVQEVGGKAANLGELCILRIKQNFSRTGTKMKRVPVLNKL